jgi:hypothetical protein
MANAMTISRLWLDPCGQMESFAGAVEFGDSLVTDFSLFFEDMEFALLGSANVWHLRGLGLRPAQAQSVGRVWVVQLPPLRTLPTLPRFSFFRP